MAALLPIQFNTRTTKYIQMTNCIFKHYFHRSSNLLGDEQLGENVRKALFVPFQKEKSRNTRKLTILGGAGRVGAAIAYNMLIGNNCDEIIMWDRQEIKDKVTGEALDMIHSTAIRKSPKVHVCLDYSKTKDSDLIIIASGASYKKGQTRLDIAQANLDVYKQIIPPAAKLSPDSVILVVGNPVDILTYAAWKLSGFEKNRVIGSGTELDSGRFRYHISRRIGVNPRSVGGWIIGEHGDSSVPVWSSVEIGGCRLRDIDPKIGDCDDDNHWNEIHRQVVADGPMVIGMKGYTNYAVSFAVENIARAVLRDTNTVHAVSTQITGLHGVCTECFMSLPCVIGNRGVSKIVKQCLCPDEIEKLNQSACILDKHLKGLKF